MSTSLTLAQLLERNKEYAKSHTPFPFLSELPALGLTLPKIVIVTCVDPRCVPEQYFNITPPEAAVFRNACGHVEPVLNNIFALDQLLNGLEMILVIHHTDCGATHYTNDQMRIAANERMPLEEQSKYDNVNFGAIATDIEQSVMDDLDVLRTSPLIRKELAEKSYGFVYDLKTGLLKAIDA